MSRSRKKVFGKLFRSPKGRKQSLQKGCRKGAVPPDAWDDIRLDNHCQHVLKVALALHKKGFDRDEITNRLVYHHGYERWRIMQQRWYNDFSFICDCKRCRKKI